MKEMKPVAFIMNLSYMHNAALKKVNATHNPKPVEFGAARQKCNSVFLHI